MPSIAAENLFAHSFAKESGKAVNKEYPPGGFDISAQARYQSMNEIEHNKSNHRRIRALADPADVKDRMNTMNFNNNE